MISSDSSDISVSLAGEQPLVERQEVVSWGPVSTPTDIAPVSFQFTNVGEAGAHLRSVYTGDPDADPQPTRCLTSVGDGEGWVIPPNGEAVIKSFDVGFNPRMQTTKGRSGEFLDVGFHFVFQDRSAVACKRSAEASIYVTPLPEMNLDGSR
ncbi:hypothetical protein GCM10009006_37850 [Haloarcula argentinensis]|uniref:Uncharacterized protein n=1 Tax=Haloarcula argentinensis TaxID=43776 RepID=A0A830FXM2_HALAR|nr:hypothetical protein GCM10009006_37850 [Haloarcula argentinensis]